MTDTETWLIDYQVHHLLEQIAKRASHYMDTASDNHHRGVTILPCLDEDEFQRTFRRVEEEVNVMQNPNPKL